MSVSQGPAFHAIAAQLVGALDQYEADVQVMFEAWPELERYQCVSEGIEQIRLYSSSLPELRVPWVELLIAHAELVHVLWRCQYGNKVDARVQVDTVRQRHRDSVGMLKQRCSRVLLRNGTLAN